MIDNSPGSLDDPRTMVYSDPPPTDLAALDQRSEEWLQARVGSLGASVVHEVVARTKSGYSASRANRMASLIVERLTGRPQETYQNAAMLHGIETEPEARALYEFMSGSDVVAVGLIRHPKIKGTHASPDGLVGDIGMLEIKCPQPAQHLDTLLGEKIADKYQIQMQWQMRCADRAWADFVSYSPAFPEAMRLFVQRVHRDDKRIAELEAEIVSFLDEVDKKVAALNERYAPPQNILSAG